MAYSPNEIQALRIGISVGRPVGNAVQRNRIKRLLRHALQPSLAVISPGWDILLLARKPIKDATFLQIQAALISLLQRSQLVMDKNEPEIRL
jgi:ribonuclease P protein component